jgi:hypothetical protein
MTVSAIRDDVVNEQRREAEDKAREKSDAAARKTLPTITKMLVDERKTAAKDASKKAEEAQEIERRNVLMKINKYVEVFPFLASKVPKIGARATLAEALEALKSVREELGSQRSLGRLHKHVDMGLFFLQGIWGDGSQLTRIPPAFRFNLSEISKYHKMGLFNAELDPILQEIDIEYPWIGRQGLFLRGMEAIGDILMKAHTINTNPEARKVLGLDGVKPKDVAGLDRLPQ